MDHLHKMYTVILSGGPYNFPPPSLPPFLSFFFCMMLATTTLEASVTIPCLKKQLKVHITQGQNIKDIVYHLVQTHAIPPYLTNSIYSNLLVLMKQACEQTLAYQHIHQKQDKQTLRQLFLDAYQSNTLQYNNKPEEDIFPRAYHTLVHCPIAAIFDTLLELENNYAMAVQELHMAREDELAMIQTRIHRQAQEIESPSSGTASPRHSMASVNSNMTSIFTRQVEEIEVFQATWQSDMLQTRQTQRQEYREFVIELYREYQARLASLSDEQHLRPEDTLAIAEKKIDGKDMVAAAAGRVKQWDTQSKTASLRSESTGSKKSDQAPSVNEEVIKSIQEMGFERDQAETALVLSNQNLEAAIGLLLENPAKVDAHLNEQKSQRPTSSTLYRRSQSLSQVPRPPLASPQPSKTSSSRHEPRRHSLQRLGASTPTFLNMMGPNHTKSNSSPNLMIPSQPQPSASSLGKSWMNSFLHQQKQAMENTNLSSVRKLGGWLGKAMENLGIDEQRSLLNKQQQQHQHYNVPQLVESFTIMMGSTQIKSSHNLRLLVTDEATEIFHPFYDPPREMAYRAETSTKLYTSHLSAVIVLVELSELMRPQQQGWRQYKTGKGSNKALFERCQQSTEFHFADIETQLSLIEQDFEDHPNSLVEGSFFVTKHANLPSTQVVFHLVVDSAGKIHCERA
ncbi:uncharacterized protein B0P05DRAFT_117366 [Gilbertella persicaria]|uniref:uncharacterized protein n=1 Tax=Gilbertella persicaria TaxID=101096 RepID=UPI002220F1F1|nr:uncharacterized protein B0P05DRAFT_117366 [Gilbertella persicaria]KAI8077916.1 hypothetical protein B0P05DRAFT_117366 [Gilbertella persicaria]